MHQVEQIPKNRLESFSDGVIAILITIMVLELRAPSEASLVVLKTLLPILSIYLLSFLYLAIYWNNHHHMLHLTKSINGSIMWANLALLFWLSLFPFATAWIGRTHCAKWATAFYGIVLLLASIAFAILQRLIIRHEGPDSMLARAIGNAWKEKFSIICYLTAVGLAFVSPSLSILLYIFVALLWVIPDKRIEFHT